jgi:hypothetical protein
LEDATVNKDRTFLTQRAINDYFDCKQDLLKKLKLNAGNAFYIYNKAGL